MRVVGVGIALALLLLSRGAFAVAPKGTNGGNDFNHFVNTAFDFHIGSPRTWRCEGCDAKLLASAEDETQWKFSSPEGTTWIKIGFISGFPANSEAELKTEITQRHPGNTWYDFDRGAFIGYSSSDLLDDAPSATEYYLVDRQQVIRIEWMSDASDSNRVAELRRIRRSIDRVSTPPRIVGIYGTPDVAYSPGDQGCQYVQVDDLRNAFEDGSLASFEIEGAPAHYSFKKVRWVAEHAWFEVCFPITTAFDKHGLRILKLRLTTDYQDISCERAESTVAATGERGVDAPYELECRAGSLLTNVPAQIIKPQEVPINNPTPDKDGPVIEDVQFDPQSLTVRIQASDATGVGMAVFHRGANVTVFYPDDLKAGNAVSVKLMIRGGWNVFDKIIVYDVNGLPTMLRIKETENRFKVKTSSQDEMYELVSWSGETHTSNIPVMAYLHMGGAR